MDKAAIVSSLASLPPLGHPTDLGFLFFSLEAFIPLAAIACAVLGFGFLGRMRGRRTNLVSAWARARDALASATAMALVLIPVMKADLGVRTWAEGGPGTRDAQTQAGVDASCGQLATIEDANGHESFDERVLQVVVSACGRDATRHILGVPAGL